MNILITGGAGFIGSHVSDLLCHHGHAVRIFDNLCAQVHGPLRRGAPQWPSYLPEQAELMFGDLRDREAVEKALQGIDAVIHLAAAVGVGQSMYEIASYTDVNDLGTAMLLEALARRPVKRLVCASSMSIYGEGLGQDENGRVVEPEARPLEQLRRGDWELRGRSGANLTPIATPENKQPTLHSVYALNKFNQERLCLIVGKAYGIATVALRFFNVYGPRQALSNPYTGVLAIFASRLLNDRQPLVFEDGRQRRDFVHVKDVAHACLLALETTTGVERVFNVASGESRTIVSVAEDLAGVMGRGDIKPCVTGKFRTGDIRHCFADIGHARSELGFTPQIKFRDGLAELAEWLAHQTAIDRTDSATSELARRGLVA